MALVAAPGGTPSTVDGPPEDPRRLWSGVRDARIVGVVTAIMLAAAFLVMPRMGGDLSAQMAHADFARAHPLTPVDFRWYGGTLPFGYSLTVPFLAAWIGPRLLAATAAVVTTWLVATLFRRHDVPHARAGAILAAVTLVANCTEGRTAFAVGLAFAVGAVCAVPDGTSHGGSRTAVAAVASLLAALSSPVAGLFLAVVAVALLLHRRVRTALVLVVPAVAGVACVSVLFGEGGRAVFSPEDAIRAIVVGLVVAAVTARRFRVVATVGVLNAVMVGGALFVDTPVGANSTRLTVLFAVPVVVALAGFRAVVTAAVAILVAVVQTPVVVDTLTTTGAPVTTAAYYTPLLDELRARGLDNGRVEVPESSGHWEAAYVSPSFPLARGWLRQADTRLYDDVFYRPTPDPWSYWQFLQASATQYVAVPDARLGYYGRKEAEIVAAGQVYLREVWHSEHWRLYAVTDPSSIVGAPARAVVSGTTTVRFEVGVSGSVPLRLRWFDWLTLTTSDGGGGCVRPGPDSTVVVEVSSPGAFVVASSLTGERQHCPS